MSATTLTVTTPSDRELVMTRVFDAPRERVFEALTQADQLRRWLLGPPGWSFKVCEIDLRAGGAYRYSWRQDATGVEMGMGGVIQEVEAPKKLVATEAFDQPWYPGEAVVTNSLIEWNGKTTLTLTIRYATQGARDIALNSPMETGVAASYDRLAALMAE